MNALAMITRCILECASARDERGRWRQERRLADELRAAGSTRRRDVRQCQRPTR